jgi:spoIIIJ-associated protein
MVSIEVEGKTPEEAIEKALEVLDAPREKVKVEVLDEGTKGLFGMIGSKLAKVKATLLDLDDDSEPKPAPSEEFVPRSTVSATKPPRPITDEPQKTSKKDVPAKEVLEKLLRHMGFDATVQQKKAGEKAILSIEAGEESSILIGKRGRNLNALQYIVNRICGKMDEGARPVTIDIEGYRQRRKDSLESMARRLASKAKSSRREMETEPLPASDRRLIHMALKDDKGVQTQSSGDGPYKNVVIKPKSR